VRAFVLKSILGLNAVQLIADYRQPTPQKENFVRISPVNSAIMVEVFLLDFIEIGFWGFQKGSHRAIKRGSFDEGKNWK
jgi:hypothetical protein